MRCQSPSVPQPPAFRGREQPQCGRGSSVPVPREHDQPQHGRGSPLLQGDALGEQSHPQRGRGFQVPSLKSLKVFILATARYINIVHRHFGARKTNTAWKKPLSSWIVDLESDMVEDITKRELKEIKPTAKKDLRGLPDGAVHVTWKFMKQPNAEGSWTVNLWNTVIDLTTQDLRPLGE